MFCSGMPCSSDANSHQMPQPEELPALEVMEELPPQDQEDSPQQGTWAMDARQSTAVHQVMINVGSGALVMTVTTLVILLIMSQRMVNTPLEGTLTLSVERVTLKYAEPWRLNMGTGNRSSLFVLFSTDVRPVEAKFKNVSPRELVFVSIRSYFRDTIDCQFLFTVDDLIQGAKIGHKVEYNRRYCSFLMSVHFEN